jgi:hypothetical protein
MANKTYQIVIDSILGGHSQLSHMSAPDQFRASVGIDPSQPRQDSITYTNLKGSGLIRPVPSKKVSSTTMGDAPMWIIPNPKQQVVFVYDHSGSLYTMTPTSYTVTALPDAGTLNSSKGNGGAYYDNYIYLAKETTIARYGPLDGSAGFNEDYWCTTLGKPALTQITKSPTSALIGYAYPNHILHRHSNGNLYILDVLNGEGVLHYISTTKTTVEGDTDNGSTYDKVGFGYNYWPSAIESYGENLVIALYEGSNSINDNNSKTRAKLVVWDTTSQNYSSISNDEFPDQFISALKNVNGTLYIISGNYDARGYRVSQFLGGNSIQEIGFFEDGHPPFPGAVDNNAGQLIFGNDCIVPVTTPCVWGLGLHRPTVSNGLFNIFRSTGGSGATVTACKTGMSVNMNLAFPIVGWSNGAVGGTNNGLDVPTRNSPDYATAPAIWWSQIFKIGTPFRLKKIKIPLTTHVLDNDAPVTSVNVTPIVYVDDGVTAVNLSSINPTTFPQQPILYCRL